MPDNISLRAYDRPMVLWGVNGQRPDSGALPDSSAAAQQPWMSFALPKSSEGTHIVPISSTSKNRVQVNSLPIPT